MWYFSKELSDSIGVITEPVISWAAPGAHIVPNISVQVCVENTSGCEVLDSLLLVLKSAWQPWWACWNNAVQFRISHLPAAANFQFLRSLSETSRKSGLVAQTCNPSTWKMYKGVVVWGSAWAILWHLVSKIKKKIEICAYPHMKVGLLFNPRDRGNGPSALGLPLTWLPQADSCYSDGKWLLEMDYFLKQVSCLSPMSYLLSPPPTFGCSVYQG